MAYVLQGIPVPTFRTPTGLTPWWRPVAVGWPTTGSTATYVGPGTGAPGQNVGVSIPDLTSDYSPAHKHAKYVHVSPVPSMSRVFGPQVDMNKYKQVTVRGPKQVERGSVVTTAAGSVRLHPGAWVPPGPTAFGGF